MHIIEMLIRSKRILGGLKTFFFTLSQIVKIDEKKILEEQVSNLNLVGYLLSLGTAYRDPSQI